MQGVNGRLLDNCQVSSLPHDCVAYRTRLRDHLKAFAGVLSKLADWSVAPVVYNIEPFHNILIL